MHATFHRECGRVLGLTLRGERTAAQGELELGTAFTDISARLTSRMVAWHRERS